MAGSCGQSTTPSEDMLKKLDEARINPIIYDPSYGAMIVSRRTSVAELVITPSLTTQVSWITS